MDFQNFQKFVKEKFAGKVRDDGSDYFNAHLLDVAKNAKLNFINSDLFSFYAMHSVEAIGLGHDLLEDTDVTYDELVALTSVEVANVIVELTTEAGENRHQRMLDKARYYSCFAFYVKIADRHNNIQSMAAGGWDRKRQLAYIRKGIELLNVMPRYDTILMVDMYCEWTKKQFELLG